MKFFSPFFAFFCLAVNAAISQVAINTDGSPADSSAMLDIKSSTKGLLIPRMSTPQLSTISNPHDGLLVYDTITHSVWYSNNGVWQPINAMGTLALPYSGAGFSPSPMVSLTNYGPGIALRGEDTSEAPYISAVLGVISSAKAGNYTTGVRGISNGSGNYTYGVWGSVAGSGAGVYGTTNSGWGVEGVDQDTAAGAYGVAGYSANGFGVYGQSDNGTGVVGTSTNSSAANFYAGSATNNNPALIASSFGSGSAIQAAAFGSGNAISVATSGNGDLISVQATGSGNGITIANSGAGNGISVTSSGTGIPINAATTKGNAISASTQDANNAALAGLNLYGGPAVTGYVKSSNGAIEGYNTGSGSGLFGGTYDDTSGNAKGVFGKTGDNNSTGYAGYFQNVNSINSLPALYATTKGTGQALLCNQSGSSGDIAVFQTGSTNEARIDRTGKGYFDGGTQNSGADLAEAFDVEGNYNDYEPGDVLEISANSDRAVVKSSNPYSTLVIGVYATKPGVLLTEDSADSKLTGKVPLGVIGVIPTKVCNENGPIARGDLLVTSSKPGYAMKADINKVKPGQILGKALQGFDGEDGKIKVLVNVR